MEKAFEMEEVGTPSSSGEVSHNKPDGKATGSVHTESRPTGYLHSSAEQDHPESSVNQVCQETDEVENVNYEEEAGSSGRSAENMKENKAAGEVVDTPASLKQMGDENTDDHKVHPDTHGYEEVHHDITHVCEEVHHDTHEDTNVVIV